MCRAPRPISVYWDRTPPAGSGTWKLELTKVAGGIANDEAAPSVGPLLAIWRELVTGSTIGACGIRSSSSSGRKRHTFVVGRFQGSRRRTLRRLLLRLQAQLRVESFLKECLFRLLILWTYVLSKYYARAVRS